MSTVGSRESQTDQRAVRVVAMATRWMSIVTAAYGANQSTIGAAGPCVSSTRESRTQPASATVSATAVHQAARADGAAAVQTRPGARISPAIINANGPTALIQLSRQPSTTTIATWNDISCQRNVMVRQHSMFRRRPRTAHDASRCVAAAGHAVVPLNP